jgi:hypothetical protein
MKFLLGLLLILLVAAGGVYLYAGRLPGPAIELAQPTEYVGTSTPLNVGITIPAGSRLETLTVTFEQNGKQSTLFTLEKPSEGEIKQEAPQKVRVTRTISREVVPDLKTGPARIVVTAASPVFHGVRTATATVTRDLKVRLEKPMISVLSTKHYVNLGGSEMVVYRATPADVESGVQVGDYTYPGYPASGIHVEGVPEIKDPAVKVAFFALLYDQDVNTPMFAYAKDPAGNVARADFDHLTFPKPFK